MVAGGGDDRTRAPCGRGSIGRLALKEAVLVRCRIHLYFAPGWELGEGAAVGAAAVRTLGERLADRCRRAAEQVAALTAMGWRCRVGRHEVSAEKPCGRAAAMLDFLRAGLDPVALQLEEPAPEPASPEPGRAP
jgi:hypothetical protein